MRGPRRAAGSALVDAYQQVRRRLPQRAGVSPQDREDIVQDACVRILTSPPGQAVRNPVGYLLRAARNLMIDRHRSRLRQGDAFAADDPGSTEPVHGLDPERILSGEQRVRVIREAMERLPPRCAEALRLHRFAGLSYPAIARRMQISCSMVEKHIAEALLRLRRALDEAEGVPAACATIEHP